MKRYIFELKVLSPLHIGDGNKITPIEYFYFKGETHFIDDKILFSNMDAKQKGDFLIWIKEVSGRRYITLNDFLKIYDRNNQLSRILSKKSYKVLEKFIRGDIHTIIKSNYQSYIPGSEIKGAIRTAIIYYILKTDKNLYRNFESSIIRLKSKYFPLVNLIKNKKGKIIVEKNIEYLLKDLKIKYDKFASINKIKNTLAKKISSNINFIEKEIFSLKKKEKRLDAKYDALKHLVISDTFISDKKIKVKYGEIRTLNINRNASEWIEYIDSATYLFDLSINEEANIKLNEVFGNENRKTYLNIDYIKKALYEYNKDILDEEEKYFKNNEEILYKIEELKKKNTKDTPLIRLGKYKGYLSNTISLIVRKNNPELYDSFLAHCTKNTSYTENTVGEYFPKTRRVLDNNIMGWCQLKLKE